MNEAVELRLAQIQGLQGALTAVWPLLSLEVASKRDALILSLIASNNDETRGRIKELSDLLELPARLQQEAVFLANELP